MIGRSFVTIVLAISWACEKKFEQPESMEYSSLSCPSERQFFSKLPTALSAVRGIIPLGEMGPPDHTLPVHHIYFNLTPLDDNDFEKGSFATDLYSPVDAEIVAVERDFGDDDWNLHIKPCKDIKIYFSHVQSLTDDLVSTIGSMKSGETAAIEKNRYKEVSIRIKAGQKLGIVGGQGITSFDMGLIDRGRTAQAYVRPERYAIEPVIEAFKPLPPNMTERLAKNIMPQRLYQFCPTDYFVSSLKTQLQSKFGSFMFQEAARGAPICQTHMRDVAGTMAGNWFASKDGSQLLMGEADTLALAPYNIDPRITLVSLSQKLFPGIPRDSTWGFEGTNVGNHNRKFETVMDNQIYCYSNLKPMGGSGDALDGLLLMQLGGPDNTELKVEFIKGPTRSLLPKPLVFQGAEARFYR
jgi:hypothetical protein